MGNGIDNVTILIVLLIFFLFILTWGFNRISILRIRRKSEQAKDLSVIMKHTLNMSNNSVLRLSIRDHHAMNMHGNFLPPEGMSFEESLNYIQPEDRQIYIDFCKKLVAGEKTSQCLFRWDINKGQGLADWRYYRDLGIAEYANPTLKTPTNIFCVLTDLTEQIEQDQKNTELTDRYRNIYEQPIVGLAFFGKDGYLMNVNEKTREIMKFQSERDPYYYDTPLFDVPLFYELISRKQTSDLFFCTKCVILERGVNFFAEMCLHPIYDEQGELLYLTLSIRDLTQERELFIKNRENEAFIRRQNEEIQQYENELQYLMEECDMRFWRADFIKNEIAFYSSPSQTRY